MKICCSFSHPQTIQYVGNFFLSRTAKKIFGWNRGPWWFIKCKWKWRDIRPSMVTHTRNLCSAINPSKVHTHSSEHTHTPWTRTRSSGQPFMLRRPGISWGFSAEPLKTSFFSSMESIFTSELFPVPYIVHCVPFTVQKILILWTNVQPQLQRLFIV